MTDSGGTQQDVSRWIARLGRTLAAHPLARQELEPTLIILTDWDMTPASSYRATYLFGLDPTTALIATRTNLRLDAPPEVVRPLEAQLTGYALVIQCSWTAFLAMIQGLERALELYREGAVRIWGDLEHLVPLARLIELSKDH
jgi:hypothetical protein